LVGGGDPCFANGSADSSEHNQDDESRRRNSELVAQDELSGAISPRVSSRFDRQPFQMPADIFRKLLDRGITALRFLAECVQHNGVDVPSEPAAQLVRVC
jgi:hypothetical protein